MCFFCYLICATSISRLCFDWPTATPVAAMRWRSTFFLHTLSPAPRTDLCPNLEPTVIYCSNCKSTRLNSNRRTMGRRHRAASPISSGDDTNNLPAKVMIRPAVALHQLLMATARHFSYFFKIRRLVPRNRQLSNIRRSPRHSPHLIQQGNISEFFEYFDWFTGPFGHVAVTGYRVALTKRYNPAWNEGKDC